MTELIKNVGKNKRKTERETHTYALDVVLDDVGKVVGPWDFRRS